MTHLININWPAKWQQIYRVWYWCGFCLLGLSVLIQNRQFSSDHLTLEWRYWLWNPHGWFESWSSCEGRPIFPQLLWLCLTAFHSLTSCPCQHLYWKYIFIACSFSSSNGNVAVLVVAIAIAGPAANFKHWKVRTMGVAVITNMKQSKALVRKEFIDEKTFWPWTTEPYRRTKFLCSTQLIMVTSL